MSQKEVTPTSWIFVVGLVADENKKRKNIYLFDNVFTFRLDPIFIFGFYYFGY